jgi:translation initiation factor IF-2
MVLLVAELAELKANPDRPAIGFVIEAELDRNRGSVATVLIQNGTLRTGDMIVAGTTSGRVRAMFDHRGRGIKEAGPSVPVSVLGLDDVPAAGDRVEVVTDERAARQLVEGRLEEHKDTLKPGRMRLSDLFSKIEDGEVKDLNIIVKADVQGTVEALSGSLEKLSDDLVRVNVIHAATGGITETDVALASASEAIIIGFNVRPEPDTRRAAEREGVDIRLYRVIYEAIDDIKAAMSGLLDPVYEETVLGRAEVRATFRVPNAGTVAGCYVTDGRILTQRLWCASCVTKWSSMRGKISSLKRFKDDVREVLEGYECGIGIERFNDVKEGDHLEAYHMQEGRTLRWLSLVLIVDSPGSVKHQPERQTACAVSGLVRPNQDSLQRLRRGSCLPE